MCVHVVVVNDLSPNFVPITELRQTYSQMIKEIESKHFFYVPYFLNILFTSHCKLLKQTNL